MSGKHCEFIGLGGSTTAIVCGVPDACDHDDNGDWYLGIKHKSTDETEWRKRSDFPNFDTEEGQREMDKWLDEHNAGIIGGSASCSKCGSLAIDSMDLNMF